MSAMELMICRVCLTNCATISLFDVENCEDAVKYCTKLMRCVNITVLEGDGLPSALCDQCAADLSAAYNFVNKCEASDRALRFVHHDLQLKSDIETKADNINQNILKEEELSDINNDNIDDAKEQSIKQSKKSNKKQRRRFGPVSCSTCGYKAKCHSLLVKHMQKHTKKKPFSCDSCGSSYSRKDSLIIHMKAKHGVVMYGKREKSNNYRNRKKKGCIQCVICGLMVQSQSALECHTRTHTGEKPFVCDTCSRPFASKGSLKKHIEIRHTVRERKFVCETCGWSFYRKNEIIAHIRRHTDEKPYVCKICSKTFRQISSLSRHQYKHMGVKRHPCPICHKMFYDKCGISKHMLVHSEERKYTCHICSKALKSRSSLGTHLMTHSNDKQYVCNYCGLAFLIKGNLHTHIRRQHSEKSGHCAVCMKSFPNIEDHMRKHSGEKTYVCKICGQAYFSQRSLSYHVRFKHENADKFKCSVEECTKSFPTAKLCEMHVLKHHAHHTPFICQHCSRGFFRSSDLTRHLKGCHMDISLRKVQKPGILVITRDVPTMTLAD